MPVFEDDDKLLDDDFDFSRGDYYDNATGKKSPG